MALGTVIFSTTSFSAPNAAPTFDSVLPLLIQPVDGTNPFVTVTGGTGTGVYLRTYRDLFYSVLYLIPERFELINPLPSYQFYIWNATSSVQTITAVSSPLGTSVGYPSIGVPMISGETHQLQLNIGNIPSILQGAISFTGIPNTLPLSITKAYFISVPPTTFSEDITYPVDVITTLAGKEQRINWAARQKRYNINYETVRLGLDASYFQNPDVPIAIPHWGEFVYLSSPTPAGTSSFFQQFDTQKTYIIRSKNSYEFLSFLTPTTLANPTVNSYPAGSYIHEVISGIWEASPKLTRTPLYENHELQLLDTFRKNETGAWKGPTLDTYPILDMHFIGDSFDYEWNNNSELFDYGGKLTRIGGWKRPKVVMPRTFIAAEGCGTVPLKTFKQLLDYLQGTKPILVASRLADVTILTQTVNTVTVDASFGPYVGYINYIKLKTAAGVRYTKIASVTDLGGTYRLNLPILLASVERVEFLLPCVIDSGTIQIEYRSGYSRVNMTLVQIAL